MKFILLTTVNGVDVNDLMLDVSIILSAKRNADDKSTKVVTSVKKCWKRITYNVNETPEVIYSEIKKH